MKRRSQQALARRAKRAQRAERKHRPDYQRGPKAREPFNPLPGLRDALRELYAKA